MDVRDILVRVVHHGVKPGGDVQQGIRHRLKVPAQRAGELGGGVAGGGGSLRVDEVNHRLRLRKVHAAVQKSPLGELPGPRLPGTCGKEGGEELPQHHRGAVAVKFGGVLPGVAVRAGEADGKAVVDAASLGVQHVSKGHLPGFLGVEGLAVGGAEHAAAQGKAPVSRDPDDADGGGGGPGGNGGDDVHQISSFSMTKFSRVWPRNATCWGRTRR